MNFKALTVAVLLVVYLYELFWTSFAIAPPATLSPKTWPMCTIRKRT